MDINKIIDEEVFDIRKSSKKKPDKKKTEVVDNPLNNEVSLTSTEKKGEGAIKEVDRQITRDQEIENSLAAELNDNLDFIQESAVIDAKRSKVKSKLLSIIAFVIPSMKNNTKIDVAPDALVNPDNTKVDLTEEEIKKQAMAELEAQITDPFTKFLYEKLGDKNREIILDSYLADNVISPDKNEMITMDSLSDANYNVVLFSDNGFMLQLANKEDVDGKDIQDVIKDPKAKFNIIAPDGSIAATDLEHQTAEDNFPLLVEKYQADNLESFNQVNNINHEPTTDTTEPVTEPAIDNKARIVASEKVEEYCQTMGIKPEQLASHSEFLELNEAQQQFILEALNRSSLNKIKVEAYNNFQQEKESKRWYHIGFALNQNFHKKKHEVLAAKEIHEKGLEGYGETEFSWLTNTIKNGPELVVDEEGDLDHINFLKITGADEERQELIDKYNYEAYLFSTLSDTDKKNQDWSNDLEAARKKLLESSKDDTDGADLVNKLIEAEKQIKLHKFLSSDPNNEKIVQSLVDNSLGSWQKFGMLASGQSDKAKYMGVGIAARTILRHEVATSTLSKAFSYAVGPAVAAALGAWRNNSRARAGLKEETDLSKLGVATDNKLIKSLNLAVGSEQKEDGSVINIGLADKLENLTEKINLLESEIQQLEKTRKTKKTQEKIENLKTEQVKMAERLADRVEYTAQKMEKGLVSYGSPDERTTNYYRLLNSLERAKTTVFYDNYILNFDNRFDKSRTSSLVTDLTRSKNIKDVLNSNEEFRNILAELQKIDDKESDEYKSLDLKRQNLAYNKHLEELNKLSVQDRLASFLNFNEDKRQSAEFKYLAKETAKGAVMGASFAALGAWIFETTGAGHWTSNQLSRLSHFTHTDQAINWVKNLVAGDQTIKANVVTTPKAVTEVIGSQSNSSLESSSEVAVVKAPVAATEAIQPKVYSEQISSEPGQNNSVWQSLREIFKANSQSLGYRGDLNDAEAVNRWAETQTANTINNSGEVTDKVFEGNKVLLTQEDGQFKVSVEAGAGDTPGFIDQEVEVKIPEEVTPTPDSIVSETPTNNIVEAPVKNPINNIVESPKADEVVMKHTDSTNLLAKNFGLPTEKVFSTASGEMVYVSDKGQITFDSSNNSIKQIFDVNKKVIPNEFVEELRGHKSLEKFAGRGGLDKVFSAWNKLGANDKTIYESLQAFNLNKLTPFDLINKISGIFNVAAKDVMIDTDTKQFILGNREFNMDAEGVHKLVRVLARRFGA